MQRPKYLAELGPHSWNYLRMILLSTETIRANLLNRFPPALVTKGKMEKKNLCCCNIIYFWVYLTNCYKNILNILWMSKIICISNGCNLKYCLAPLRKSFEKLVLQDLHMLYGKLWGWKHWSHWLFLTWSLTVKSPSALSTREHLPLTSMGIVLTYQRAEFGLLSSICATAVVAVEKCLCCYRDRVYYYKC